MVDTPESSNSDLDRGIMQKLSTWNWYKHKEGSRASATSFFNAGTYKVKCKDVLFIYSRMFFCTTNVSEVYEKCTINGKIECMFSEGDGS